MKSLPVWPPTPGFYQMTLVRNGPLVPVRIWFGAAVIDGEEQDRGDDWHCEINGETDYIEKDKDNPEYRCRLPLPIDRVWPFCARRPISEGDYRFMVDTAEHAVKWRPDKPQAHPRKAIDKRGASVF